VEDLSSEHQTIYEQIQAEMANPRADPVNWAVYTAYMEGCRVAGDPNIVAVRSFPQAARIVPAEISWPNLRTFEDQALLQIIVGQQPVDYFDTFVADWLAQGGSDLVAKLQQAVDEA
jgi:putative aldouronate transport system substrate-binding protein